MDIKIKWLSGGKWALFPVEDILHLSRNHAIALFSRSIPVLIKQDDIYISNDRSVRHTYHKRGIKVIDLAKAERSEGILSDAGFI